MKPWIELARVRPPGSGELSLHRRDRDLVIRVDGQELMSNRSVGSEQALATIGCAGVGDGRVLLGYAAGLDATARPIRPHQAPVDGGDAVGVGTALTLAVPVAPGWSIGVEAGVVGWELPWIEHSTCVANCPIGEPLDTTSEGRSVVMQGSFALTPTFRRGDWTVFASATIKNQPTIEHKDTEYGVDVSGDVEGGPGVWLGAVGLSARLVGDLRVSAILYAPLERGPVATGPSLATMLTLPLGPRRAP